MPDLAVVLSCEHAGNHIPRAYRFLFRGADRILRSHRGHDPGGRRLARQMARALRCPLIECHFSRLLIEVNRSPHHPRLFSEYTRCLEPQQRRVLLRDYYQPHRHAVEQAVRAAMRDGCPVLHIGVHTFTPLLRGMVRQADVGLLYDPGRRREMALCRSWQAALRLSDPRLRVRRNYPYRGTADGLTTSLRRVLDPDRYLGIELEVNQKFPRGGASRWRHVQNLIVTTLRTTIALIHQDPQW